MPKAILSNWDAAYYMDVESNKVVKIISENSISVNKKEIIPVEGGLHTKELGSIIDIDKDIRDCCCKCQNLSGNFYEGEICPKCNTVVEKTYIPNLEKMGWIDLEGYYVITPQAYQMITTIIPQAKLKKIITFDTSKSLDIEGNLVKDKKIAKSKQYDNIGLMQFRKHFEEIITYYAVRKKKPEIDELAAYLIKHKNRVFASKIMVYSSYLRPLMISSKQKQTDYDPINKCYAVIATSVALLKRNKDRISNIAIPNIIMTIQETLNELYKLVFKTKLSGKHRLIRAQIGGGRMSWSARLVIIPNLDLTQSMDEVKISYKAFLELFSLEISNIFINGYYKPYKYKNMIPYEIISMINRAKYSNVIQEDIYNVMCMLIKEHQDGLWLIIERPPVLELGSIQMFRISEVIKDATTSSLMVPTYSLTSWNGDLSQSHLIA